jgi:hypothetical protein
VTIEFPVALMGNDDRVLHLPALGHGNGVTVCGVDLNAQSEWQGGPFEVISDKAEYACERCFG